MWARGGLRRMPARGAIAVGILAITAAPAGAKVLPIASVSVPTATPAVGKPFTVTVRFRSGKDFVDAGWENDEVYLLPAARTDAQGWPRSLEDRGTAIPIHRVGFGVFRGTAVVHTPGRYVVVDASAVDARVDRAHGVVVTGTYASPVRLHVVSSAHAGHTIVWLSGGGALLVAAAIPVTRRRRRRAPRPEELVPVAG